MPLTSPVPLAVVGSLIDLAQTVMGWPQVLGLPVLALAVWAVYVRTQDSSDPRGSVSVRTDTGAASISISGAYWIALLVGLAAFLMQPVLAAFPWLVVGLVGLVGTAWWLEKQEAMQ